MREYVEQFLRQAEEEGRLTPEYLVEQARDPSHILHEEFTWEDREAAHQHRMMQARQIIRGVRYKVTIREVVLRPRAYVHDPDLPADEQGYISVARISGDSERAQRAFEREVERVRSAALRGVELGQALGISQTEVLARLQQAVLD